MTAITVPEAASSAGYRYVVVLMLTCIYTLNFLDRQIISILAEPILKDLHLTDTQLGLLGGITFAALYTTCGIPVAWLADRANRVWIISCACGLWSLFTALCGSATNFFHLALLRMGVGVGEAGGSPPSYSLLSDYFPPEQRGTALSLYSLGVPLGSMLGTFVGGRITEAYGWRVAFYALGIPGIILAVALPLVVREPKRGALDPVVEGATEHEAAQPMMKVIGGFFANPTLLLTAISCGLSAFVGYAALTWNPPFLIRVKGMRLVDVANYYSLVLGITGIIGTFGAGWLVDRLGKRDRRWFAWLPAICFAITLPFWAGLILAPTWQLALLFMAVPLLLNTSYLAPALTVVQNAVPPAGRTMAGAILLFVMNIVGLGIGPVYVGRISDMARAEHGEQSLVVGFWALLPIIMLAILSHIAVSISIARDKR